MINITVSGDFVGEGVSWIDSQIKYIGDRSKKALNKIAETVRHDIEENVLQSRSINGGRVADNAGWYREWKGFNRPLFHTGRLSRSIKKKSTADGHEVFIGAGSYPVSGISINEVASRLQFGFQGSSLFVKPIGRGKYRTHTARIRTVPRPFFGISESTDNDIDTILGNIF